MATKRREEFGTANAFLNSFFRHLMFVFFRVFCGHSFLRALCAFVVTNLFALPILVAGAAEVVTVDGRRIDRELVSVGREGITFQVGDQRVAIAAEELVRWSHPARLKSQPQVLLADGTVLVAADDWTGRGSVQLDDETLTVVATLFDQVPVPRRYVTAVLMRPPLDTKERQRLADELRGVEARNDVVWLDGGDRIAGTVAAIDGQGLAVVTESGDVRLRLEQVVAVAFNPQLVDVAPSDAPPLVVGLGDGSLLRAAELVADGENLMVTVVGGQRLIGGTVDDIAYLQTDGNPAVAYLSDLEPADYRHVPYLDIDWPWQPDRNLLGGRLSASGNDYLRGVAMHSAGRLTFAVDGTYRRFEAEVAMDDAAGRRGSVVFRVFVARNRQWQAAWASDVVRGGDPPVPVSIDIAGAEAITLVVDYADRGDELDHANWLDARLVK